MLCEDCAREEAKLEIEGINAGTIAHQVLCADCATEFIDEFAE